MKLNKELPEEWNPAHPLQTKESLENAQNIINESRKRYYESLPDEEKKKLDAIESAVKLLTDNNVKFALFGGVSDTYFQFNKVGYPEPEPGDYTREYLCKILPMANSLSSTNINKVLYVDKENNIVYGHFRNPHGYMESFCPNEDKVVKVTETITDKY